MCVLYVCVVIDETRIRIHPRRLKHELHQRFKMVRNGVPGPPECSRLPAAVAVQVSRPLPAKWRSPLKMTTPVLQHGWETDGKNGRLMFVAAKIRTFINIPISMGKSSTSMVFFSHCHCWLPEGHKAKSSTTMPHLVGCRIIPQPGYPAGWHGYSGFFRASISRNVTWKTIMSWYYIYTYVIAQSFWAAPTWHCRVV